MRVPFEIFAALVIAAPFAAEVASAQQPGPRSVLDCKSNELPRLAGNSVAISASGFSAVGSALACLKEVSISAGEIHYDRLNHKAWAIDNVRILEANGLRTWVERRVDFSPQSIAAFEAVLDAR